MLAWLVCFGVAALTASLGVWAVSLSGPVQAPNGRSSHRKPTPVSGGLGVALGVGAGLTAALTAAMTPWLMDALGAMGAVIPGTPELIRLAGVVALAGLIGALGGVDDVVEVPARLKFAIIAGLSVALAAVAGPAQTLSWFTPSGDTLPYAIALAGSALWIFTVVNAVNFMDGANGLVGGAGAAATLGLAAMAAVTGGGAGGTGALMVVVLGALALAGGVAGFLPWNARRRARVFMGDAGSLFIGALFAALALMYVNAAPVGGVYLAPILAMPLLADVLLTLAQRARRGAPLLSPHRDHAYQHRLRAGMSHPRVARGVWLQSAACAAIAVWIAAGLGPGLGADLGAGLGAAADPTTGEASSVWSWAALAAVILTAGLCSLSVARGHRTLAPQAALKTPVIATPMADQTAPTSATRFAPAPGGHVGDAHASPNTPA